MGHRRNRPDRLAEKLLQIRKTLGLSQREMAEQLAERAGVVITYKNISKYERDKSVPFVEVVLAYARLANVLMNQIVDDAISVIRFVSYSVSGNAEHVQNNKMSTDKPHSLTARLDEMRQQFEGRIVCERCGNRDWSKFTYLPPMDGRVLVQCSQCGLTFFKLMEPNHNDAIQK
jgi:transcriptional regulator with XRE-family HTH domain